MLRTGLTGHNPDFRYEKDWVQTEHRNSVGTFVSLANQVRAHLQSIQNIQNTHIQTGLSKLIVLKKLI